LDKVAQIEKDMIQTLKSLVEQGIKYAVLRIDETKYWKPETAKKAGRIDGVYVVDLTQPTNLCSFEVNYPAELIKNFFHNTEQFDTGSNEFFELENVEGMDNVPYFLESDSFEVAKTYTEGESLEDIIEQERANPCVC